MTESNVLIVLIMKFEVDRWFFKNGKGRMSVKPGVDIARMAWKRKVELGRSHQSAAKHQKELARWILATTERRDLPSGS